jgi:CheY-like chemotaxis protein
MRLLLIVDDGVAIRDTLTELVGKDGREILTAGDGQEALNRLAEVPRRV